MRARLAQPRWGVTLNPYGNGAQLTRPYGNLVVNSPDQPWSFKPAELNGGVDRFEVRPGDYWQGDHGAGETYSGVFRAKNRCEIVAQSPVPFYADSGHDVWLSLALRVTLFDAAGVAPVSAMNGSYHVLGQFRPNEDPADYAGRSPALAHDMGGPSRFLIDTRADPSDPSTGNVATTNRYLTDAFTFGVWHYLVHRVRFARTGLGQLDSWLDGVQVFTGAIPIGFNDVNGPGWKYGIYRAGDSTITTVAEYATVELITDGTSLLPRVATPLPLPI